MSAVSPVSEPGGRAWKLAELLDRTDYRVIISDEDREAVFRLRYQAYLNAKAIDPDFSERLSDRYDDLDNTTIYGLYVDGELAASIRVAVANAEFSDFASRPSFDDILAPQLEAGKVIIDPSRLVTNDKLSHEYEGLLPFLTIRVPWLIAARFRADTILATVRVEHQAFYRRVFGCEVKCEPRPYLKLTKPLSLMTCDFQAKRDWVHRRYPVFCSSEFERRMLIDGLAGAVVQKDAATAPIRKTSTNGSADGAARVGRRVA